MDQKQELSSIDLGALVTELRGYTGAKLDKAYLYGEDMLRLKMRDFDAGRVELIIEVGDVKRAHVAAPEHVPDAPGRPPNFAKMLRNRLSGADLVDVRQYEFDRILVFEFEREDQDTTIVAELFGKGNIAVLDETGEVVQALSTVRLKSRTVAPGAQYEFPSTRLNPLDVSFETFVDHMSDSDSDVVRTLATQLNLGGLYAEEVCARAGIDKETPIAEADEDVFRAVHDALARLDEQLITGEFDPRIYLEDDRVVDVTPFALVEREHLPSEGFDSFNAAVDSYFYRLEREAEAEPVAEETAPDFEERIAKHERIIEQQEGAIQGFEQEAEDERERAELLYANYDLIDEILSTVQEAREAGVPWEEIEETFDAGKERGIPEAEAVLGVDGSDGSITVVVDDIEIDLDAGMGVEKNADRLYTEAKRIESKKDGALEAIEETREELESIRDEKEAYDESDEKPDDESGTTEDDGEADAEAEYETDWLSRSSIPVKQAEHWYERFRWFHTSDGFLVIGGRSADQNEELVKKYMDRHDRFFHSQAHGGPVTLLKAAGPSEPSEAVDFPDASLSQAAQFAVSYSSVWKEGRGAGDAYMVDPEQVSKTPESGEYLEKGGFVIRGDRTYFRDVAAQVAVGIRCEPDTRVIGGPPDAIEPDTETSIRVEPGMYAQNDMATKLYREFRTRFADESFVRKVASADRIQEFLPPGGSEVVE